MTRHASGPGGVRIAYDVTGDGPPVLLIHGFAASRTITWKNTSWYDWLSQAGQRVIAFDCRGHGESDKPHDVESYDDRLMIGDAIAVLDAEGIERAAVMGYSMGGYMTSNLLHLAPSRVTRAVVAGVGATYFSFWPERNEVIAQGLEAPDASAIRDPLAQDFRGFAERAGGDLVALAACMRRKRLSLAKQELAAITHRLLIVCGENDTISGRPEPLAEIFPNAEALVVPRKNHHSTVGDLVFKRAVRKFLA